MWTEVSDPTSDQDLHEDQMTRVVRDVEVPVYIAR